MSASSLHVYVAPKAKCSVPCPRENNRVNARTLSAIDRGLRHSPCNERCKSVAIALVINHNLCNSIILLEEDFFRVGAVNEPPLSFFYIKLNLSVFVHCLFILLLRGKHLKGCGAAKVVAHKTIHVIFKSFLVVRRKVNYVALLANPLSCGMMLGRNQYLLSRTLFQTRQTLRDTLTPIAQQQHPEIAP